MPPPTPDHDGIEAAIVRVRAGDREAFRVVIAVCEGQLRALVAAILPNLATVDDVVQKTLVVAFYRLDQYQAGTSFIAWIATIARYQALNERRRWLAERSFKQRFSAEHQLTQALYHGDDPGSFGGISSEPLAAQLSGCIASLREQAGEIVKAHYLDQEKIEDIAARYGRSNDWVHLVLHRARKALRSCLTEKLRMDGHGA